MKIKAAMIAENYKINCVEIENPSADNEHVLIKVNDVAICGSDKHFWDMGDVFCDWVIGHEYSGVVEDPGPRTDLKKGDRVTSVTMDPDLNCPYCLEGNDNLCDANAGAPGSSPVYGACSEYFAARADLVLQLPDNVSDEEGAMVEPASVSYHGVKRVGVKKGDKVLITGAGVIGAFAAEWCRYFGAELVVATDVNMNRANKLVEFGACNAVFDAKSSDLESQLLAISDGGFDIYIDTTGFVSVVNESLNVLKKGRPMLELGVNFMETEVLNMFNITTKEYTVMGSFAYTVAEFKEVIDIMASKKINFQRYAGKKFSLPDVQQAFEYLNRKDINDFKVMLSMHL